MTQTDTYTQQVALKIKAKDQELIPAYATKGAAGADVRACLQEPVTIPAHSAKLIPTGLFLEIPAGFEVQIRPRSGLALKNLITVLNTPGTIDEGYRGEIGVVLINHGKTRFDVHHGMKIAQLVVAPRLRVEISEVGQLSDAERGSGGFGSTG